MAAEMSRRLLNACGPFTVRVQLLTTISCASNVVLLAPMVVLVVNVAARNSDGNNASATANEK